MDFLDEESLIEAEVLLAVSGVSGWDRMFVMLLSAGTGETGTAVVFVRSAV